MDIEIIYASSQTQQTRITQQVPVGCTVAKAVKQSRITHRHPEIMMGQTPVGIFGQRTTWDHMLQPYDRIEIYRPLQADPKQMRRRRLLDRKAKTIEKNDGYVLAMGLSICD